jgi:NifU-like protein involved in Fe-S cluster formation
MPGDPYSPLTRRLFAEPAHVAPAAGPPASGESVYLDGQGLTVRLNATVAAGRLETLTFRASGCPHFIAACEWLCRHLEGKPVEALDTLKPAEIMQTLGIPVTKTGRILVLEDAVRALGACLGRDQSP